jgi:hypothetical protein
VIFIAAVFFVSAFLILVGTLIRAIAEQVSEE